VGGLARLGLLVCLVGVVSVGSAAVGQAAGLPDGRSYELVSPLAKNGGSVIADTQRTRAAADGSAVGFAALTAFADPLGTGVGTDYVAVRDPQGTPDAGNGWATHAVNPLQSSTTIDGILSVLEPLYVGEFTRDLTRGVFFAQSPLTGDPFTAQVPNLYMRSDLRTPGAGAYALITGCPLCASRARPLPALALVQSGITASQLEPFWAGMSPDGQHVVFESRQQLTADAPASLNSVKLYEWDQGTLSLSGRIPPAGSTACDDSTQTPACVATIAQDGAGASLGAYRLVAHGVSDGSDGHTRVFFTRPAQGDVFMRVDGTSTVQVNVSERTDCADHNPCSGTPELDPGGSRPASYLDASANGERVFFMTVQALTDDAPASTVNGGKKLYMYDVTRPAGSRLTFLSADHEPADGPSDAAGMIGASADGHYAYFIVDGQLISGQPLLHTHAGIYLWHDGALSYVGPAPDGTFQNDLLSGGTDPTFKPRQARVTPDGRHLLFSTESGVGLGGYDQGFCIPSGCRELYLYNADTGGPPVCVSCNPSGAPATVMATDQVSTLNGGSQTSVHQNEALTDDGSRVFFSTAEALVPEDVNARSDAYEYDVATRTVHLLSSGTSTGDSWFMDASSTGDDAFFVTREQLVGWDTDQAWDLYDARVDGGWPQPAAPPVACAGDACQPTIPTPPLIQSTASAAFHGSGNLDQTLKTRPKPKPAACRKGFVKKRIRGRDTCVRRPKPKPKARHARRARTSAKRGRA